MKNIAFVCLFLLLSTPVFANGKYIEPADKAKILRHIGESVFVQCKKLSPFSTNCRVDCGNGVRYQKAKGYCHYLNKGKFLLRISTRQRGRNYTHTAVVSIIEKTKNGRPDPADSLEVANAKKASAKASRQEKLKSIAQNRNSTGAQKKSENESAVVNPVVEDVNKNINAIANEANKNAIDRQINSDLNRNRNSISNDTNSVNQPVFQQQFVEQ